VLGRKSYTKEEFNFGKKTIADQVAAHRKLAKAVTATKDKKAETALAEFDAAFYNNMVFVLDRLFVHRFAGPDYEGKDGNPLNELRIICDSLLLHDGIMRADRQIKLPPDKSVVGIAVGDRIALTEAQFEKLADAFFEELAKRFL
jgi:hypothetical protein